MAKDVAVKTESLPPVEYAQTPQQIKAQVVLIQEVMRDVMTEGQHFGTIPGCGDKPTLFKSGAEKLSLTFRLRPIMDEHDIRVEELPNGHKNIRVDCHIMNQAELEIATGVGSCSTMESKFRYRDTEKIATDKPIPAEYWKLKGDHAKQQALIGGKGFCAMKLDNGSWVIGKRGERTENPDIADTYNTVLKMAKKRAYVDGVLSATAASDCFTQDIEDMHGDVVEVTPEPVKPAPVKQTVPAEAVAEAEVVKPKPVPVAPKPVATPASVETPADVKTVQGIIEDKKVKAFVSNGKAGNKYGCKINGDWYGTFDSKTYDLITKCQAENILVNCEYKESPVITDGKTTVYYNIVSLKQVVANEQGQATENF
jgi:hypothetical protein